MPALQHDGLRRPHPSIEDAAARSVSNRLDFAAISQCAVLRPSTIRAPSAAADGQGSQTKPSEYGAKSSIVSMQPVQGGQQPGPLGIEASHHENQAKF